MSDHRPGPPRLVRFIIASVIATYPTDFREAFGDEIEEAFAQRYLDRRESRTGWRRGASLTVLIVSTVFELLTAALAERLSHSVRSVPPRPAPMHTPPKPGAAMLSTFVRDILYGLRGLKKQPGFAAVAVITLGVGIGANTAIFSLVNGILLRALRYPESDRLVSVWTSNVKQGIDRWGVSLHDYTDWRERSDVFADLGAYNRNTTNVGGLERPQRMIVALVTPSVFSTLGVPPALGRTFVPEEDLPGSDVVVVVSDRFWRSHLRADPDPIGERITVDGRPMTVVGVMPAGFAFPDAAVQLWKPFGMRPEDEGGRDGRWVSAIARLNDGLTLREAQASLTTLGSVLERDYPQTNEGFSIYVEPQQTTTVGGAARTLFILWGTAGLVLLIACSNLANLLLSRATTREREVAVRAALGASRKRLVAQLLAESVPLSLLGAALGILLAVIGVRLVPGLSGGQIPRLDEVSVDTIALMYTLVVALGVGVLFTIMPALRASRLNLAPSLRESTRGTVGRRRSRMHHVLVAGQVSLAVVVVAGAGLLFRSFVALLESDPGFVAENVLSVRIAPSWAEIPERAVAGQLYSEMQAGLTALPGVMRVSAVNRLPLAGNWWGADVAIEGRDRSPDDQPHIALTRIVLPGYHSTMGIPVLRGRGIRASDEAGAPPVTAVNRAMAEAWWPDDEVLGRRIDLGDGVWRTIVGIVDNVQPSERASGSRPMLYVPFSQGRFGHFQDWGMTFVVRGNESIENIADQVRAKMSELAPNVPLYEVASLEQVVNDDVAEERFITVLLGLFAGIALLLAVVGVYSVMAYSVTQRTQEIGVRVALGARNASVLSLVLRQGLLLTTMGIAVGLLGAVLMSRWLTGLLYQIGPLDPVTYGAVVSLLVVSAMAASIVPAVRATRVDPLSALRAD